MPKSLALGLMLCVVIAGTTCGLETVAVGGESQPAGSFSDRDTCPSSLLFEDSESSSVADHARAKRLKDTPECRGKAIFFDEYLDGLGGNGRACSTCHVAEDDFQLTPAHAFARLRTLQKKRLVDPQADDPLFRPIDADDFRVNGENANDYTTLRRTGSFALPSRCRATFDSSARWAIPRPRRSPTRRQSISGARFRASSMSRSRDPTACFPNGPVAVAEPTRRISARRTKGHAPGAGARRVRRPRAGCGVADSEGARRPCGVPEQPVLFASGRKAREGDG